MAAAEADASMSVSTQQAIAKPPSEVYDAIVDPAKMSGYFISEGSARLDDTGVDRITWKWGDVGAEAWVKPKSAEAGAKVEFEWGVGDVSSEVVMTLEGTDGDAGTMFKVTEGSWAKDDAGVKRALGQMQGWVNFALCLKAYVQYGINLRK